MPAPIESDYEELKPTPTPFKNIALALSGGGFRAASFSLGVLSYLNEVMFDGTSLLQNVSYISSASGGTIANAMYALNSAEGQPFGVFYKNLFENLEGEDLLEKVFSILNDDQAWKKCPHKERNFINAFSLAYDELLFNHKQVIDLRNAHERNTLDEVCFNTTDFYRGLLFRQEIKLKPDKYESGFLFGNFIFNIKDPGNEKLKIADLLAASSCFPAGFEPIMFPFDFANDSIGSAELLAQVCINPQELKWKELDLLYPREEVIKIAEALPQPIDVEQLAESIKHVPVNKEFSVGLMDGGITDNQGIESVMRANDRRVKGKTNFKEFDLMLINDVGSNFMDPYEAVVERKSYTGISGITLNTIKIISIVLTILGFILLICGFFVISNLYLSKVAVVAGTIILLVFGGLLSVMEILKKFIKGKLADGRGLNLAGVFSKDIVNKFFHHFDSTPVAVIVIMLKDRFNSVLTLNNDVYLKRIRQLLYQRFLDEGRSSFRMKTNHVYDLSFSNDLNRMRLDFSVLSPNNHLQVVAQIAAEMGTTLWFDSAQSKDGTLGALVACGQFTTCYNLLEYIHRMKEAKGGVSYFHTLPVDYQEKINQLETRLNEDYNHFKNDPFILYNALGKLYDIDDFEPLNITKFKFPPKGFLGLRGWAKNGPPFTG